MKDKKRCRRCGALRPDEWYGCQWCLDELKNGKDIYKYKKYEK